MDRPLHIIHLIFALRTGGSESMLIDIANGQAARHHRVEVVIINDEINPELLAKFSPDVRITCLNRRPGSNRLALLWKLNLLLLKAKPDIIHGHNSMIAAAVRVFRKKLVMTVHAHDFDLKYCKNCSLAAISESVAADVKRRHPGARIEVITNGLDLSAITRRTFRKIQPEIKIVQVGSLYHEIKGQDLLIEAVAILKQRGIDNVRVDFIGSGYSEDYLRRLVDERDIAEKVSFLGSLPREEIYDKLSGYDAMVHPSRFEGFGLTVAEAMAAGVPLIVTRHDGPWEVAGRGEYCLCGVKDDAASFADAIETLINDYDSALARAADALEYVRRYDISHTVDNYISFYKRLN